MDGITVPSSQASATVGKVCADGVLRVAFAPDVPKAFQDKDGTFRGPGVEIVGPEVAKLLGVKYEIMPVGWDTIVAGVQTGRYEIATAGINWTEQRAAVMGYVLLPGQLGQVGSCYLVRKDSSIQTLKDLNSPNVTIGFNTGSSYETEIPKYYPLAKTDAVVQGSGGGFRVADVLAKRIDAAVFDSVAALAFKSNYPSIRLIPADCPATVDLGAKLGYGIPLGDTAWQTFVTAVVDKNQNAMQAMIEKYSTSQYIEVGHE
jgi:cyclohexadienyl dehydratase